MPRRRPYAAVLTYRKEKSRTGEYRKYAVFPDKVKKHAGVFCTSDGRGSPRGIRRRHPEDMAAKQKEGNCL